MFGRCGFEVKTKPCLVDRVLEILGSARMRAGFFRFFIKVEF